MISPRFLLLRAQIPLDPRNVVAQVLDASPRITLMENMDFASSRALAARPQRLSCSIYRLRTYYTI
ncbi:MAG TPA: hypothetical protein VN729_01865 [Ktedonobacteraceae bacterium]|nr:hypothetical protein [Ktedonobacteraceae bacterium]